MGAWLLLAILMVGNGALREVLMAPALGRPGADVPSALLGMVIVLSATRPLVRRLAGHPTHVRARCAPAPRAWRVLSA